jgi:4-amino-4-deoxychorismate lyase
MILVNGAPKGEVSAMDRGLAYGDGVFRTFRARRGRPLHWARQFAKLARDCAALGISPPAAETLERDVVTACAGEADCAIKIIVTRGAARRGYAYAPGAVPTCIVLGEALGDRAAVHAESGVSVRLCALRLSHQAALAGVKHLNRLENVIARAEWSDPAIAEGILLDLEGQVVGGTMTNVFVVRSGIVMTPPLDRCGVAGVTRDRVIEAARALSLSCSVRALSWADVLDSEEAFLVNSLAGVWPVRAIEGVERTPGRVTRAIQRALCEEDDAQVA